MKEKNCPRGPPGGRQKALRQAQGPPFDKLRDQESANIKNLKL